MNRLLKRLLLVALLCVPWVTEAQTDTLTVASGTETNSYVPFYGFWTDASQHNQVLYPAAMTATIVGDSITGMGFYMSSNNSSPWGITVTVSLGISSNAALTGLDNTTALTQVWQGTVNGQGNIWIHFDNAYPFQGGNLLVDIQTTAGTYSGASFYGIAQTGGSYYSYNSSGGVRDFIPKTSFLHVQGDFNVCLMPSNLVADIDSNNITLSWNPAAGVSGYNIYMNDSLVSATYTDTSYTFSNLTPNTVYSFRVTSDCNGSESPAIGGSFRTDCGQMVIPFMANFDSDPYGEFPPCWTRVLQSGTDPSVNGVWSHSGTQSMYLQASNNYNMFASQAIPLAGNNIKVNFWTYLNANYFGWIKAGVMTNRSDTSTFIPLLTITDMNSEWTNYEFSTHDLDANATYYAAFLYYGTQASNYGSSAIDDISITTTDGCAMPRLAAIDTVDTAFVTLYWVPGSSNNNYELAYGTSDDPDAATLLSGITDTTYTVNGLNPGTMYYFWVRNICTTDDTTAWMFAGSVRTACSDGANAPYVENLTGYSYGDIPACWTILQSTDNYGTPCPYISSGSLIFYPVFNQPNLIVLPYVRLAANAMDIEGVGYVASYNPCTFEVGYVTNPDSASTFVALGSITATSATEFEFNTSAVTADSIWIAFRATTTGQYGYAYLESVRVGALGSCTRPDYLALDTVSYDMAELHCNNTNADEYEVAYATVNNVNSPNTVTVSASDTVISLTNLSPSTHYYTWVRSLCGTSDYSDWRQGPEFTTTCGENYCTLQIVMHDSYGDGWNGNAINVFTNGVFQMQATLDDGSLGTATHAMCDGDTVTLVWVSGSYPSETSFEVTHAGAPVTTGGGSSLTNGQTIATLYGCPSCMPVASVVAVDSLATDESITVSWTPNSGDDTEWAISINGQVVDVTTNTYYTINNLTPNMGYNIGVATVCGGSDTSDYTYVTAGTACGSNACNVIVEMIDSYGDGWNGNIISLYQNGGLKGSATLTSGNYATAQIGVCEGDSIEIRWTTGDYITETSFRILSLAGDTLYAGSASGDGFVGMTDTVDCPACVSPTTVNVTNITSSGVSFNWNANGMSTGYHVTVNSASAMVLDTVVATAPLTVTGLQPATGYTVMVYSICDNDTASATVATFVTSCVDITLPWSFVAANDPSSLSETMPLCWFAPQVYGTSYASYPYNDSYDAAIYIYASNSNPCMAATPRIPADGNNIYVRFHAASYSSNGTTTAGIITNVNDPTTYIPIVNISATDFTEFEFTTDAVPGLLATDTVHIAFQATTGSGYSYLYVPDVYVQVIPNCSRPDSVVVSNITDNGATLTWPATGANSYTVFYGDTAVTVTGTTVTLTGLNGGFTYVAKVQGNCTSDTSLLRQVAFTTVCVPVQLPWSEGFENTPNYTAPNCWTMVNTYPDYYGNTSPYVTDDDWYAHTGNKSLAIVGTSGNSTMAISPLLVGEPMNTLHVSFWVYGSSYCGFEAGLMTNPGVDSTFVPLLTVASTSYNYTQYSFMTNTLTGTDTAFHFAIRYISTDSYSNELYVDDITVMRMPDCADEFSNIAVSGVTGDGATLAWTPGLGINANSSYTINLMDANNMTVSTVSNATSPHVFTGLPSSAEYHVAVNLTCGGSVTAVSDTVSFTTLCSGLDVVYSYDSTMTADQSDYAPMGMSNWNYGYTQTIIDSARLVEGNIVGFAFLPATELEGDYYTHIDVYMANVSESDLNAGWITPDSNHVFVQVITDADMCYDTADWQQHIFTQPFTWDGHSNVLLSVRRSHGTYSYGASFAVHTSAATNGKTRYSYNDYNLYDINDPGSASTYGDVVNFVSDLKLLICGDACPAPVASVTVNDYQGATINWTCSADTVEYALRDATEPTYQIPARVPNNGMAYAGNLNPATTYFFHIRAVCEDGVTSEWTEVSFTTDSLPCFAPTALQATPGYVSVALDWEPGTTETMWNVHIWNSTKDTTVVVNTNPAYIGGLAQTTTYYAAVSALCGGGAAESDYSDTIQFTTATCAAPTGVAVSNVTGSSAVVTWEGNAASYDISYGERGFGEGQGQTVTGVTGTTYTITGLEPDMAYDVYVRANCEAGVPSGWSSKAEFTTGHEGIHAADGGLNVTIYPNPTTSATTISLSGVSGEVEITIVDMNGRTVKSDVMSCDGDCAKKLTVDGLAAGAYFVRISADGVNAVKKLVVK